METTSANKAPALFGTMSGAAFTIEWLDGSRPPKSVRLTRGMRRQLMFKTEEQANAIMLHWYKTRKETVTLEASERQEPHDS